MDFIRVSVSFLSFFLYFGRFQRDFSEFLAVFLYNEGVLGLSEELRDHQNIVKLINVFYKPNKLLGRLTNHKNGPKMG